jgi:hypothetical protein
MRAPVPAVVVGLAAAALGAVILGEYPLEGLRALLAAAQAREPAKPPLLYDD